MSLPSLSRLTSDLKLSHATVGAITNVAPPAICSICIEPLYGCDKPSEQALKRARMISNGDGDEGPPQTEWPNCPHEHWYAPYSVAILNRCGHFFHKTCIGRNVRHVLHSNDDPTCPECRAPISREDCDELLEVVDGPNSSHVDNHPAFMPEGGTFYYEGPQGQRFLVRVVLLDGTVEHYTGEKGNERLVREVFTDGVVQHYKGERSEEKLFLADRPNGDVLHYEVGRLVRVNLPGGEVEHYEGEKGAERFVREVFPSGEVQHYEGEKGAERLVRVDFPHGTVNHYEGEWSEEKIFRVDRPNGDVSHFEGGSLVRRVFADGTVDHYEEGSHVRTVFADGEVRHHGGWGVSSPRRLRSRNRRP